MKLQRFTFNAFGVNTYVVWDAATLDAAIIDPGMVTRHDDQIIFDFIDSNHLNVKHLINTHLHIDHVLGDARVKDRYGVPIEAHHFDDFLGENLPGQSSLFGLGVDIEPIKADIRLEDGDEIMIGDEPLKVMHIPGHSPGSIALYAPQSGFVISGDVLFHESIGRTDLPGGNQRMLIDGIRKKIFTLPSDTVIYPGHGPETTVAHESINNPFF